MGERGTDVARESADLVLLDDNFSSIVSAIRLGRGIFENLRKAMSYILAIHVPIAGLTLVPVIFGNLPIIFFPIHVAFLELIIDPTCSIVFGSESAPQDIMTRPPRKINDPILSYEKIISSLIQGVIILSLVLVVYFLAIRAGKSDGALLVGNFFLTFANKSWKAGSITELLQANKVFMMVLVVVPIIFGLILYIPTLRELFYFI
jgi:Ca2+-transporting ATPase